MPFELTGLEGRVVVVTGAGRMNSIGRSVAEAFARASAQIAVTGTGRALDNLPDDEAAAGWRDAESVADIIRAAGGTARAFQLHLDDSLSVDKLATRLLSDFGGVDVVVNCAAAPIGADRASLVDIAPDVWHRVFAINVTGVYLLCRAMAPLMIAGGRGGSILNISSLAAKIQPATRSAYAASKAAVDAITGSLSKELGPHGIRVNSICPGYIATARNADRSEQEVAEMVARIPLGRPGTADDVAALAVFLASDAGAWISGQQLNLDGGQLSTR